MVLEARRYIVLFLVASIFVVGAPEVRSQECANPVVSGPSVWPPYFNKTLNGKRTGQAFEMADHLFHKMSRRISIDPIKPWARVLKELEVGKIDIVLAMLYSDERAQKYHLTKPWAQTVYTVVTLKNKRFIFGDVESLNGKYGGYLNGTVLPELFRNYVKNNDFVLKLNSVPSIYKTLIEGRLDYVIVARDAFYEILPDDISGTKFLSLSGSEAYVPIDMAISKNSPCSQLMGEIDTFLAEHKQSSRPVKKFNIGHLFPAMHTESVE